MNRLFYVGICDSLKEQNYLNSEVYGQEQQS